MRILQEPLLHFLVLGVAIFGGYSLLGASDDKTDIVVTRGQQNNLIASFEQTRQRPPTPEEFDRLVLDFIRQEIAYRVATEMELDRDDIVIRRRLRQKLELLTEDLASLTPPTEEDLDAWFMEHAENYRTEPRYSFRQISFSADLRGDQAREDALLALAGLQADVSGSGPIETGDVISLPPEMRDTPRFEIAAIFGSEFSESLEALPTGSWAGPVESGYGQHLVRISSRVESRIPRRAEVEQAARDDLQNDRRLRAIQALYDGLAENYRIIVEPAEDTQIPDARR